MERNMQNGGQMPDTVFVTGGTGYIGARFLLSPAARRYGRIVCLSRVPAKGFSNVEYVRADLFDSSTYASALAGCDTVLHMAAVTGKSRPSEYFRVNGEGTKALLDQCVRAGGKRFIYVSSIAAKFRDQTRYYYAQSKVQAEKLVAASGLRYTIVRPTMVIGKGSPVLEGLIRLASAPVLPVFGNGRALVQPVSVNDLVACLDEILRSDAFENRTVEIGGPQVLSVEEFLVKIRRARGKAGGPVLHLPAKWIAAAVGVVEKALLPLLPFTAGQIASFVNDGAVSADAWVAQWQTHMESVDRMLLSTTAA
jgi:nucleoside-diphosphate-sugar epimerase